MSNRKLTPNSFIYNQGKQNVSADKINKKYKEMQNVMKLIKVEAGGRIF